MPSIVLSSSSIPDDFKQSLQRAWTRAEIATQGTYSSSDLSAWGYLGGYEREFERRESSNPVKISSEAGAYSSVEGITRAFQRNRLNCQINGWQIIRDDLDNLGSESLLCTRDTTVRAREARVYLVIWRTGRVKSAVTVTAFKGKSTPELALRLARQQADNY